MNNNAPPLLSATDKAIERWVTQAAGERSNSRRQFTRLPFFHRATVRIEGLETTEISAFTKDISRTGIGLIHDVKLDSRTVTVEIQSVGGTVATVQAETVWSKPIGEGWNVSGMRFVGLSVSQNLTLLARAIAGDLRGFWNQRHPFFCPAILQPSGKHSKVISAFSRDISLSGIGLIHSVNVDTEYAHIRIESNTDPAVDVPIRLVWSKPFGPGIYVSGWQFRRLDIAELDAYRP